MSHAKVKRAGMMHFSGECRSLDFGLECNVFLFGFVVLCNLVITLLFECISVYCVLVGSEHRIA